MFTGGKRETKMTEKPDQETTEEPAEAAELPETKEGDEKDDEIAVEFEGADGTGKGEEKLSEEDMAELRAQRVLLDADGKVVGLATTGKAPMVSPQQLAIMAAVVVGLLVSYAGLKLANYLYAYTTLTRWLGGHLTRGVVPMLVFLTLAAFVGWLSYKFVLKRLKRGIPRATVLKHALPLAGVAIVAYVTGMKSYEQPSVHKKPCEHSMWERPETVDTPAVHHCDLYPQHAVCKAMLEPGGELIDTGHCFAQRDMPFALFMNEETMKQIPEVCKRVGPLKLIELTDLASRTDTYQPVTMMPPSVASHYEESSKGVTLRSALVTYMIITQANGEDLGELGRSKFAELVRNLDQEEQKTIAVVIGQYSIAAKLFTAEVAKERERIARECAKSHHDVVPIECLAVAAHPGDPPPASSTSSPTPK